VEAAVGEVSFGSWPAEGWSTRRRGVVEMMDADGADPAMLRQSLEFIERVNRWLGYTAATIRHLDRLTHPWPAGRRLAVLDIATGTADMPRAIGAWAARKKLDVAITAIDRHEQTLAVARQKTRDPRIRLLQADALRMPFNDNSFDIVTCSMFLHHLDGSDAVKVIRSADRLARHGVIIADLLRGRRALAWISLFTLFSNAMVKHDARVSVRQAFTVDELCSAAAEAGAIYLKPRVHFGHRVVLSGIKPQSAPPQA